MGARRTEKEPSSPVSRLNMWIGIGVGALVLLTTIFNAGRYSAGIDQVSQKVDTEVGKVASKIDAVSTKVDTAASTAKLNVDALATKLDAGVALTQAKQDALTATVEHNQQDQANFRTNVQNLFTKVFDGQAKQTEQLTQERIDRLSSDAAKKK